MLKYLFPIIILSTISIAPAKAQEVCGKVINLRDIGEAEKYCSVYERQLAFREERMKFRKQLEERREDFIAPQLEARKRYQKDLQALHAKRSHDNDFAGR